MIDILSLDTFYFPPQIIDQGNQIRPTQSGQGLQQNRVQLTSTPIKNLFPDLHKTLTQ